MTKKSKLIVDGESENGQQVGSLEGNAAASAPTDKVDGALAIPSSEVKVSDLAPAISGANDSLADVVDASAGAATTSGQVDGVLAATSGHAEAHNLAIGSDVDNGSQQEGVDGFAGTVAGAGQGDGILVATSSLVDGLVDEQQFSTASFVPASAGAILVKARVLVDCAYGVPNEVVELDADLLATLSGIVDPAPEAVAYAESLRGV